MNESGTQFELPRNIERYLATLSTLYAQRGQEQKQRIIVNSHVRVHEKWSYDNWNGGTYGHAIYLVMPEALYLDCIDEKDKLRDEIREDINKVHSVQNEFVEEVFLEMEITEDKDWRNESGMLLAGKRTVPAQVEKRIWDDDCFRVFLGHKAEVKEQAAVLKQGLRVFGVSCFVAHDDIHPTKEWQDEIESALFSMDALVALMTEGFHESDWTDQEVGVAFGREVPIIAVKFGRDPYGFVGKFQALSCSCGEAPVKIVKLLITHARMLDAYVKAMDRCDSFDHGNELSEILPSIDHVSDEQASTLVSAFNANVDVSGSFGFNGKRPLRYGRGLAFHLKRLTGREYRYPRDDKIQAVP